MYVSLFIVGLYLEQTKIIQQLYLQKSTLERYTILVGFYANACQGKKAVLLLDILY